ncbi:MAG: hypothetical protein NVS3B10_13620 [Polyangiales bacterium]
MLGGVRVHHVAVVVADLAAAERFYVGVLGLPVERRWSDDSGAPRSIWLRLDGDARLMLERAHRDGARRLDGAPGWHCVALAIEPESREAWRETLAASGFPPHAETAHTLYVRDPDGNVVALSDYPIAAG